VVATDDYETFTYKWAALPTSPATATVGSQSYDMLAMNYVLVNDRELVDVKMEVSEVAAGDNAIERNYTTVPVQRNYRTYIVGNLLTTTNEFNVTTVPGFTGFEEAYYVQDGNAVVATAAGLDQLAADIAEGKVDSDIDIVLDGDIDLAALATRAATSNWTPIGTSEEPYTGTFNGNGYSIKNLNIVVTEAKEGKAYIGFFGYAKNATIKNVTFENVNLNIACLDIDHSQGHIGAVAGSLEGTSTIENVTVKGDVKVEATVTANGASRVAVVAGGNSYGNVTMKNVHVIANEGSYLKANNNVGALAGQLQGVSVFENCSSNIDVTGTKFFAGGIIGLAAGNQTFTNCHTTGDVTVTAGREGRAHDHYRVGGIAGGWADGAKNVCTLTDCSYTGTLSGTNADGSVAATFDYAGYVGRGYTLNGCAGSKVVVDNVTYVQKYNTAAEAGIYDVYYTASTAEELTEALKADKDYVGITLAADINTEDSFKVVKDIVLDLAGHTIAGTDKITGSYALIEVQPDVNFEITNTAAENGKLTVVATNNRNWNAFSSVVSNQRGTLTVGEGVVIEHLGGTDMAYGIDNLTNTGSQKAIATINGATVKSPYRAIRQFLNSTAEGVNNELYVNSGVIEGANKSIWMQDANAKANPGKLVVAAAAQLKGNVYLYVTAGSKEWPVEVSIASDALVGESTVLTGNVPAQYEVVEETGTWIVKKKEGAVVSTAEEFTQALSEGGNVFLQENIDITKLDLTNLTNDVVIDANGKTITTESNYGVQVTAGKNITLKNAKVEMTVEGNYITYAAGLKIENGDYQGTTISLENCEIRMCNTDWAYAVNLPASVKNLNLVIDGCTLEGAIAVQCWGDNNTITMTNSNLICNYTTSSMYTSYCVALQGDGTNNSENNTLNISGCAFSYSGVDNYNSTIKAVFNHDHNGANTITVDNCTYDEKVEAY
ncbi:MAG: hypothetical protein IKM03_03285, partial [Alistipes sp.]|nr:hypothetical protein [Alistipes sp.]